jgi:Zn-dependent protease
MFRSYRIGRIFGVPVDLHWTFLLVPGLIFYLAYRPGYGIQWASVSWWVAIAALLFLFVLVHELGHALAARNRGLVAEKIILFPLGGGAYLPESPSRAIDEVLIYAAGPLANIALAGIALPLLLSRPEGDLLLKYYLNPFGNLVIAPSRIDQLLGLSVAVNLVLAAGNLLPAYPLDGGRILRALLRAPLGNRPSTVIVTGLGMLIGVALLLGGMKLNDYLLASGGGFIAILSVMEYRRGWQRRRLARHGISSVLRSAEGTKLTEAAPNRRLYATDQVRKAKVRFAEQDWPVLPVFDNWNDQVGFVERNLLEEEAADEGAALRSFTEAEFVTATPDENLLVVTERIVDSNVYGATVYADKGQVIGYVFTEDVIGLLNTWPRRARRQLLRLLGKEE